MTRKLSTKKNQQVLCSSYVAQVARLSMKHSLHTHNHTLHRTSTIWQQNLATHIPIHGSVQLVSAQANSFIAELLAVVSPLISSDCENTVKTKTKINNCELRYTYYSSSVCNKEWFTSV